MIRGDAEGGYAAGEWGKGKGEVVADSFTEMSDGKKSDNGGTMHRRRVTLEDGRYLIFYSFDGAEAPPPSDEKAVTRQPDAIPVAEEEPRV